MESDGSADGSARKELGIGADHWTSLGSIELGTSKVRYPMTLDLACGPKFGELRHDGTETMETIAEAVDGRITYAASCVLILKGILALGG